MEAPITQTQDVDLQIDSLQKAYTAGTTTPDEVLDSIYRKAVALAGKHIWIDLFDRAHTSAQLKAAVQRQKRGHQQPLFGIPFAIKDNIDYAGFPTTAACPAYSYEARESALVVSRLLAAGAILIGKTNMDQFATGLVGTRSPYGACPSAFDDAYISGGSSSGSGLAVAHGLCSFALGTDTAGSGRVPAGLNNIVGLKPTRGLLSCSGVVPACRSLDCVSIFAGSVHDAFLVEQIAQVHDPRDPFSRPLTRGREWHSTSTPRVGIPRPEQLEFFGDAASKLAFEQAASRLEALGATLVPVDLTPFNAAANLLYTGPWVAERFAGVGEFIQNHASAVDATVRGIVLAARSWSAVELFRAQYKLNELRQRTNETWSHVDLLMVPTTPTTYTIKDTVENPVELNSNLGRYTNFVNLLDLCAVAVPAGFKAPTLPFGVTFLAPAFEENQVCQFATRFHHTDNVKIGATTVELNQELSVPSAWMTESDAAERAAQGPISAPPSQPRKAGIEVAVVGAHLRGQPLHHQLEAMGAQFVRSTTTAARYELFALAHSTPPKPGLVRRESPAASIAVEVYNLEPDAFGNFVALVPPPLCIGNIELESGAWVKGFLCEPRALVGARDITKYGGWVGFLKETAPIDVTAESR